MSNLTLSSSCTVVPESVPSDAGIAGAGILLAFIATATLALLLSTYLTLSEIWFKDNGAIWLTKRISRKVLLGLSDQQLISGISIQSLALARMMSMVPYHFFICWLLALLSTSTNFAALLALVQDFKRDWVLRWLRQAAMFVNMALTVTLGVLVLEVHLKKLPQTLVVGCVWNSDFQNLPEAEKEANSLGNNTLSTVGTIAVIAASAIIFVLGSWYLHLRRAAWGPVVRVISLLVLWATAIGATVRLASVSQAFGHPSVALSDEGERVWSFGQLFTMVMLISPLITALEIFRGELQVPACRVDGKAELTEDRVPLTTVDGGKRYTYQPNPFSR